MIKLAPLVPPHRLDLRARDVARAFAIVATAPAEARARGAVEDAWGGPAFLSVRSGLCALLEASGWEPGSEILVSAVTITDIPKIIAACGFVPVAVDVDPETLAPSRVDLERLRTKKTRALIVAHLFGARVDLDDCARFCRTRDVMLIEDCAQAFIGPGWRGDPRSDVAMFSFGTLKTQTALGGALFTVRDDALRARMTTVEARWPLQSTTSFAVKLAKTFAFLAAQHPLVYGAVAAVAALCGSSIGAVLRKATKGFPAADVDALLVLLRKRPCPALLAFLRARVFDHDGVRLDARAAVGELLLQRWRELGIVAGARARLRTHWIFGLRSRDPARLRAALDAAGVDASGASNITAVGGVRARALVEQLVFVPAYPELGDDVIRRVVDAVEQVEGKAQELAA